ncbi:MAG: insulinase family protein [bacterium]|nr:insulinase family protein [bacterium]
MKDFSAVEPRLTVGQRVHGFVVEHAFPLPRLRMMMYVCQHEATGACVVHLHADDEEQVFAIVVRTPAVDDTGLPHILEHTVLCGSEKYPVKEPFTELLKTSLATYLNAHTGSDHTTYPCASINRKDFYNLASVYCDAVFHPRLLKEHFQQEGYHLAWDDQGELTVHGVVYQEMKGYYAELDQVIARHLHRCLFAGSAYAFDAGGEPVSILQLTYERFKAYYERHYHVGNAAFFFYGSLLTEEHLQFLAQEVLTTCRTGESAIICPPQPSCSAQRVQVTYPIGAHEPANRRTAHVIAFLTHPIEDVVTTLALQVLEFYLLGHEGAPLRRALIESGVGTGLIETGLATHQPMATFSVGVRGSEPELADAFQEVLRGTLQNIVAEGLDSQRLEVALYQRELALRTELCTSPAELLTLPACAWLYRLPWTHFLQLDETVAALRQRLAHQPRYLEDLLTEKLLHNPRYCCITCVPDRDHMTREATRVKAELAQRAAQMTAAERARLREEVQRLRELQTTPDPPEARATLPRLGLADVSREPRLLPTHAETVGSATLLHTETFTNGLVFFMLEVDLRGLDEDLWEYLPVYANAVTKVGAGEWDFAQMAEREAACCGGINASLIALRRRGEGDGARPLLEVMTVTLERELPRVLELFEERLLRAQFADRRRLRDVVLQQRACARDGLQSGMITYARRRSARSLSEVAGLSEQMAGLTAVRAIDHAAAMMERSDDEVIEKLERLRAYVARHRAMCVSMTGGSQAVAHMREWLAAFQSCAEPVRPVSVRTFARLDAFEGISLASHVAANALSVPVEVPDEDVGLIRLLCQQLSYGYLWERVRMQGSAYSASAIYFRSGQALTLLSGDDPHIRSTLEVFMGACDYIERELDVSPQAMEQAIVGTLKRYDRPLRGGEVCMNAVADWITGTTPEKKRRARTRLLEARGEDLRRISADVLRPAFHHACVCIVGGEELLARARKELAPRHLHIEPAIDTDSNQLL